MENILSRQSAILESIKTIKVNFSKDSSSRKTAEYLENRLIALDSLWVEFEKNDTELHQYEDKSSQYFTENIFDKTKDLYYSLRSSLSNLKPVKQDKATAPSGKVDELLSKQRTNFRAFSRMLRSINVDEISEKWELEDELRNIKSRWNIIDTLHLEIDDILQGGDLAYEDEYLFYELEFKKTKRALNKKLSSTVHTQQSTPLLEIPIFTGKYTQWPTFFDLFSEAIHNNTFLTNTQKMQHLKGKVRGEAERLIHHLHISAENYETAWEILVHRYNNKQLLFNNQIEVLLNQPSIEKQTAFAIKRFHDTSVECIHSIHNLGVDTNSWDPLIVYLLTKKLDADTLKDYKESRKAPRELPELAEFISFLEAKFEALEPMNKKEREYTPSSSKHMSNPKSSSTSATKNFSREKYQNQNKIYHARSSKCPICNYNNHSLYQCRKFISMSPEAKLKVITKHDVCKNCLYKHFDNPCISTKRCKECNAEHNSILHDALSKNIPSSLNNAQSSSSLGGDAESKSTSKQHSVNHIAGDDEEILLTTVLLKVRSSDGTFMTLRALLDQGAQISLVSHNIAQQLGLHRSKYHASVAGIGDGVKQSKGMVTIECHSIYNDYQFTTKALVISKVINNLPNNTFSKQSWSHIQNINLADPDYNLSRPIDLLLDASVYSEIIMNGLIKGPSQSPIAQQTRLGWILSGNVKTFNCHAVVTDLPDLSRYWEVEDITTSSDMSSGDQYCEEFYKSTTTRLENGMYEVGLPMKPGFEEKLGETKSKAVGQFYQLERKLAKNEQFATKYKQFMAEYQYLGQMIPAPSATVSNFPTCYLPHHGVLKLDSTTTSLRVVFNASSVTSTGTCLNDLMERGPNLQADLQSLIITWRQYKYVMTADIEKMFRRIFVNKAFQPLQSIIWRSDSSEPLRTYHLTTVTYGTKAAPFLAMRTLKQLAIDDASKYPLGSSALTNNFYMDDYLGGTNALSKAKEIQNQLIDILKGAGMNIRKWSSNHEELVKDLSSDKLNSPFEFRCSESRKTLGLKWNPSSDSFVFDNIFKSNKDVKCYTKRQLLSNISKVFDPMGWISPVSIRAKLLFQKAWTLNLNLSWDDKLPLDIFKEWEQMREEFKRIDQLRIPRHMGNTDTKYHIHGFCDASEKAFACAVYCVTVDKGRNTSRLIVAKTKLSPVNKTVSLPRLELCGALLLSQLIKKVLQALSREDITIHAWTDSMVVLGWIHGDDSRWKQFVANRVRLIKEIIPATQWNHVSSEDNPADCATRGISLDKLSTHHLWWQGPEWLTTMKAQDKPIIKYQEPIVELKKISVSAALNHNEFIIIFDLINNNSSLSHVARTIAWVSRFIARTRHVTDVTTGSSYLTADEINRAYIKIIKTIQIYEFSEDLISIKNKGHVPKSSKIASLNPFVDEQGLLRVGGRLNNADINWTSKHPIILSSHSRLTDFIISQAHATTLHGGARLTLSYIREKYWIICGMRTVKRQLRQCVRCKRFSQNKYQPIMADLPKSRVVQSRSFTNVGVDFTGSVDLKLNKGRGVRTTKGYIAIFVCFSTKAVHLELVSDLSTPAFLAAFQRFCSRRGVPSDVYSDNGTNFVGASRVLKREYQEILATINRDFFNHIDMDIQWHFNAPANPSAGGLWEASVKSLKYHLKRVIGDQKLTYEEFNTLLHQIEACLNSRPLCPLTENPDEPVLTPGHFLIGGPLLGRPHPEPENINLPKRWHLVQTMNKQFWKRWSSEYLQQLQVRSKWRTPDKNIEIGDVVLLKEDNLPPGKWAMGRVQEVHPGKDGHIRVVSVKTQNNIIKRPVIKLVPLLRSQESSSPPVENKSSSTNTQQNQRSKRPRLKVFHNLCVTIFMCLSFLISPSVQLGQGFNITELSKHQGLYFDRVSQVQCIRDDWKLIIYYNMSTYWASINNIHNYISHLKASYTPKTDANLQDNIILQLDHDLEEIDHYNSILYTNLNVRRHKRGLINGVGYIANSLFGVLDERFAQQYQQDIETLRQHDNHLQKLIHNQTIIMEAESNILKRHEDVMKRNFALIEQHINQLNLESNRVRVDTNNALYFSLSSLTSHIILTKIRSIQQTLIDTVTDIYQGHISSHMLPPEQLQQQINIISGQLQGDLVLPVDRSNIMQLYKLLRASTRITAKYLIVEVKIPLVGGDLFELDNIISIPQKRDDVVYRIVPAFPFIGFNIKRDSLILLSENDLSTCKHASQEKLLCSLDRPIYDINIKQSICDIQLVNNGPSLSPCSSEVSSCRESWIKLHADNTWLFACCEECTVRIICPTEVTSKQLRGNGIIQLDAMCTIKGNDFSIFAHNNFMNQININEKVYFPEASILNKLINTSSAIHITTLDNQTSKWHSIDSQISELKEQSNGELTVHDIHHYILGYLIIGVLAIISSVIVFQRLRARCARRAGAAAAVQPPPAPPGPPQAAGVASPVDSDSDVVVLNVRGLSVPSEVRESIISVDKGTSPMITRSVNFDVSS